MFEVDGSRKPETDDDLAVTRKVARSMKEWGTPPVIIGKMIVRPARTSRPDGQRPSGVEVRILPSPRQTFTPAARPYPFPSADER